MAALQVVVDMFNHNNTVVDHQSERYGDGAERHDIQIKPDCPHDCKGDDESEWKQTESRNCRTGISKEGDQCAKRQYSPHKYRFHDAVFRLLYDLGLIVKGR